MGQGGTDWDRTNTGSDINAGRYWEAGATDGYVLCHFLVLSTLLLLLLLLLLFGCLFFYRV